MFDIDAGKLLIIGLVALVVIGPKDLPRVLRQVGQMVARLRRMAGEFQGQFMEAMKEADLQDLRAEVAKLKDSATLDVDFDPARDVRNELTKAIQGPELPATEPRAVPSTSTSEREGFRLPAPAEVGTEPDAAAAGFAPVAEPAPAEGVPPPVAPDVPGPVAAEGASPESLGDEPVSARRKIVVARRRPAPRFGGPTGGGPAPNRPRNIRPARRETADR